MKFPTNEGGLDRILRVAAGAILGGVFLAGALTGVTAGVVLALSLVLLLTGIMGFCPLYALLHISTLRPREDPAHRP